MIRSTNLHDPSRDQHTQQTTSRSCIKISSKSHRFRLKNSKRQGSHYYTIPQCTPRTLQHRCSPRRLLWYLQCLQTLKWLTLIKCICKLAHQQTVKQLLQRCIDRGRESSQGNNEVPRVQLLELRCLLWWANERLVLTTTRDSILLSFWPR